MTFSYAFFRVIPRLISLLLLTSALFAQSATYRVHGVLLGDGGQPQSGAKVAISLARGTDTGPQRFTTTDAHGAFTFDGLPAGNYRLLSHAPGYLEEDLNQHENYFSGVIVGPGKDAEHIVFPLRRAAVITGIVTDDANDPVRGAQVMLFRRMYINGELDTRGRQRAQTDDRGVYSFRDLPPGEYFLAVTAHPWYAANQMTCPARNVTFANGQKVSEQIVPPPPPPDPETAALDVTYPLTFFGGSTDDRNAKPIRLRAGDRFSADVTLTPVPAAHVRVHTAITPSEQTSANVRLISSAFDSPLSTESSTASCGDGISMVSAAPGRYTAIITTHTYSVSSGEARETGRVEMPLDVTGDMDLDPEAAPAHTATISGIVQLNGKSSSGNAARIYFGGRGKQTVSAELEANGAFKPVPLTPGHYEVMVFSPNGPPESRLYLVETLAASGGGSATGHSLNITGGPVTLALSASNQLGDITGIVLEGEKPIAGAMVLLVPNHDIAGDKTLIRRDQTDSDGSFSLRSVPYGAYTVLALRHGWEMEWANPAVLKPYLSRGVPVLVDNSGKSDLRIPLQ